MQRAEQGQQKFLYESQNNQNCTQDVQYSFEIVSEHDTEGYVAISPSRAR